MASELTLDRADPGIDSMVAGWKKGETYHVSMDILYTGDGPGKATFEPTEVVDESPDAPEEDAPAEGEDYPPEKPKGKMPPGKMMGKPALTISFHK